MSQFEPLPTPTRPTPAPGDVVWVADHKTPQAHQATVAAVTNGHRGLSVHLRGCDHAVALSEIFHSEREAQARVTVWLEADARDALGKLERWRRDLAATTFSTRAELAATVAGKGV